MKVYTRKKVLHKGTQENGWDWYFEVDFIEYDENGRVIRKGSEDFDKYRMKTLTAYEVREAIPNTNRTQAFATIRIKTGESPKKASHFMYGDRVAKTTKLLCGI
jgi:hypothetical protein